MPDMEMDFHATLPPLPSPPSPRIPPKDYAKLSKSSSNPSNNSKSTHSSTSSARNDSQRIGLHKISARQKEHRRSTSVSSVASDNYSTSSSVSDSDRYRPQSRSESTNRGKKSMPKHDKSSHSSMSHSKPHSKPEQSSSGKNVPGLAMLREYHSVCAVMVQLTTMKLLEARTLWDALHWTYRHVQRQILSLLYYIKYTVQEHGEKLNILLEARKTDAQIPDEEQHLLIAQLPATTLQDLLDIEDECKHNAFQNQLIVALGNVGGKNTKDATVRVLRKLLLDDVACQYSWFGAKGKRSFSELTSTCKIIKRAVRKHIPSATDIDIQKDAMNCLRHATERCSAKSKVTSQQSLTR